MSDPANNAVGDAEGSICRQLEIVNQRGLHARASAKFVKTSQQFESGIIVSKDGNNVGGTSIMGLMMLAASKGCHIIVCATGSDAPAAIAAIEALVADRFGEEC